MTYNGICTGLWNQSREKSCLLVGNKSLVQLIESRKNLLCNLLSAECLPELQVCRTLQQSLDTVFISYTGKLNENTASRALHRLHIRLYYTETVNT